MRHVLLGTLVVLAALVAGWLLWHGDDVAPVPPEQPLAVEASPPPAAAIREPGRASEPDSEAAAASEPVERVELPFDLPLPAGAGTGSVIGTVRYEDDRQPVADVVVRLDAASTMADRLRAPSTRTAADGSFAFARVPVRIYTLACALGGTRTLVVREGSETRVNLLVPRGLAVAGVVIDDSGQPVGGADIWMSELNATDFGEIVARSDARGTFRIGNVLGARWIGARARGHRGSALSLVEGRQGRLELVLVRDDARVRGFVRDAQGQPCAGATVVASPPGEPNWRRGLDGTQQRTWAPVTAIAGDDGSFAVAGLAPGALRVRAHAPGHGKASLDVDVAVGGVADVVLTLPLPACVFGRVAGADGAPVRAFLVFGRGDLDASWVSSAADGVFRAADVSPGDVGVEVWQGSNRAITTILTLAAGETREWNPVLGRAGGLRGRVVDSRQQPLAGFGVVAFLGSRGLGETRTDDKGGFALDNLPAEALTLRVGVRPEGGGARARLTALVVPDMVPPRDDLLLVVPDERLPSVTVWGRVLRADGMPAHGAKVRFGGVDERGLVDATADERGEFKLAQLLPGDYWISVLESEHPTLLLGKRTFAARDQVDLGDLRLAAGGRIVVTPTFAPGVAEGEIAIEALDAELRAVGNLQRTGASLRSPVLPAGQITLLVSGRTIARARHEVTVQAGRELQVELSVQPGLRRSVRATLPADAPTPRWVWASAFAGRDTLGSAALTPDTQGRWQLDLWLPATDCVVVVGTEGQRLHGQVDVPGSLPDGALLDVVLQTRD